MIQLHWESIFLSHQCVTTVFAGWSFQTVWNITYQSKCLFNPLPINDEWWVYIIMDPHYSNNIFVCGTTHETGHKQPKFVSSANAHYSFLNLKNLQKACIIYQSEIDIWFIFPGLHLSKKCLHNKKMSSQRHFALVLYIKCKQYLECIFCFVIN